MDALPVVVQPRSGEHLLSLIERLAAANGIRVRSLCKAIGAIYSTDKWGEASVLNFARMGGLDPAIPRSLIRMSADLATCRIAINFLGIPMKPSQLAITGSRVCPLCLVDDGHLHAALDLLHVTACPTHGTKLLDTCTCGSKISLLHRGAGFWTCRCGNRLADLPVDAAGKEAVEISRWLTGLMTGSEASNLPGPLEGLCLSDAASVIDLIGYAATTPAEADRLFPSAHSGYKNGDTRSRSDLATLERSTVAAAAVLSNWPTAYHAIIDDVASRVGHTNRDGQRFATSVGRLLARPYRNLEGAPMPCLVAAMRDWSMARVQPPALAPRLHQQSLTYRRLRSTLTRKAAAEHLGVKAGDLLFRKLFSDSLAHFDSRPARSDADLRSEFLRDLRRRWDAAWSTMSSDETSRYLDHETCGRDASPWIHERLLAPVPDANRLHGIRRRHSFRTTEVEAMRDRLADLCAHDPNIAGNPEFGSYTGLIKTFYCGGYSKTAFLLDVLDGRIAIASIAERPRLNEIHFNLAHARDASWSHRLRELDVIDRFWVKHRVETLLNSLWPSRGDGTSHEPVGLSWLLRQRDVVRRRDVRNTSGGRDRPLYHYSVKDVLHLAARRYGRTVSPAADMLIATLFEPQT